MPIDGPILVTGARGFLGSNIVALARANGRDVVAAYRGATRSPDAPLDVCDAAGVEEIFATVEPSLVIHCASYGVNYADQDPELALAVNVHGPLRVLTAAARHEVMRFVHVGSCFEYGSQSGKITEEAPLNPTAIYGATKAAASLLMRERARALGVPLLVVRPFGMWGPGEAMYRLIPQVIKACVNGCPLQLTACEVVRDYTYVEDMADRILALALSPDLEPATTVNAGSGQGIVLRDFVLSIARMMKGERLMHFGELQNRPTEMASLVADVRRMRNVLGERPETSLSEGIRRTVARLSSAPSK
jgi:nucleoside-diphosphate-sugar epimerase